MVLEGETQEVVFIPRASSAGNEVKYESNSVLVQMLQVTESPSRVKDKTTESLRKKKKHSPVQVAPFGTFFSSRMTNLKSMPRSALASSDPSLLVDLGFAL